MSFERTRLRLRGRIAFALCALALGCVGAPALAQEASPSIDPTLRFEIVSIRPHSKDDPGLRWSNTEDGITIKGIPLSMLVKDAYGLESFWERSVPGIPSSLNETKYDIQAKMDANTIAKLKAIKNRDEFDAQRNAMMLAMLEDRFKLKAHTVTKEEPIYSLVIAKGGLKMKESAPAPVDPNAPKEQSGRRASMSVGPGWFRAQSLDVRTLARNLQGLVQRKVVDNTGLKGLYDFTLKWSREDSTGTPEENTAPSLFTALQEELGLELKPTHGPMTSVVVDHIEPPSEN